MRVEAVGHSLPGRTATGLPVGKGIVAVDDVASAITGWIIDLWFPSLHEAGAWGRKSVVITVYR